MLALDESEMHGEPKALGESHAQAHLNPPQGQEAADRNEAEEAPEGVKLANSLRYKEYLGMVKMERQIIRKLIEGPTQRRSAPLHSSGGVSYEVGGVTIENLLAANRELRDRQGKLVRAMAALIGSVKEAEEGSWEAGSGLRKKL